nr:DUF4328 domain-containing protein [Nakamurella flavida]
MAVTTAVLAVIAAGAEAWRFALLLAGRTQVLSGSVVRVNDALVTSAGLVLLVAAVATAVAAVPVLVRLHGDAARRSGRLPSRRPGEVAGWLLAPVANLYGAGVIVGEIDARLIVRAADPEPPGGARPSRLVSVWWAAWVLNGVLVLAALVRGSAGSLQAVADTVELHVAVDLTAALVAGLGAAVLGRFARLLTPAGPPHPGWRVADPAPTRAAAVTAGSPRVAPPAIVHPSVDHPVGEGGPAGPRPGPVPAVGAPGAP